MSKPSSNHNLPVDPAPEVGLFRNLENQTKTSHDSKWKRMHNFRIKSAKAGSCPKYNRPTTSGIDDRFRNYLDYFANHRTLAFDEQKLQPMSPKEKKAISKVAKKLEKARKAAQSAQVGEIFNLSTFNQTIKANFNPRMLNQDGTPIFCSSRPIGLRAQPTDFGYQLR